MKEISISDLIICIKKYMQENKMSPTAFGTTVLKDPSFVFNLEKGKSPRVKTVNKILNYINK